MAADGPMPGKRGGAGIGQRAGLPAIAVMLGFLAAGLSLGIGAGWVQAAGVGMLMFGLTLWLGSLRSSPASPVLDERTRRQRHRSVAIALGLGALVLIFYAATIVRLGPNALKKDGFGDMGGKNRVLPADDPATCKKAGTC
jgi:hypothetical protein